MKNAPLDFNTLDKLTKDYEELTNFLTKGNGEINEHVATLMLDVAEKIDSCYWILSETTQLIEREKENKRLKESTLKDLNTIVDTINDKLKQIMLNHDKKELTGLNHGFSLHHSKLIVDVVDFDCVPKEYLREKVILEVDKIKAYEDMKNGKKIPGLMLKESYSLRPIINLKQLKGLK